MALKKMWLKITRSVTIQSFFNITRGLVSMLKEFMFSQICFDVELIIYCNNISSDIRILFATVYPRVPVTINLYHLDIKIHLKNIFYHLLGGQNNHVVSKPYII